MCACKHSAKVICGVVHEDMSRWCDLCNILDHHTGQVADLKKKTDDAHQPQLHLPPDGSSGP